MTTMAKSCPPSPFLQVEGVLLIFSRACHWIWWIWGPRLPLELSFGLGLGLGSLKEYKGSLFSFRYFILLFLKQMGILSLCDLLDKAV